ncbi:MAG: ATP-binding protein [Mediterranea sp.]|nr:ATP-binding protein [Mediterranea sp.]
MRMKQKEMELKNPFLVYGYVSPRYFCDREEECKKMLSALDNERNVTLIAPRRIGKTGLIKNVFYLMQQQKAEVACFYMDIFATRDLPSFVRLLAGTVLGQLETLSETVLHKLTAFFRSCRPVIRVDELTGAPVVSLDVVQDKSEQTLKEIFDYMAASGKRCYLAIDEFQQIASYPEKGTEALLRSHIQFLPNVRFVFAGSSQHLMEEMFTSAKRPFYQSTQLMALREIGEEPYYRFAFTFFEAGGLCFAKEVFSWMYKRFEGYTWYVQTLLNRLYEQREPVTGVRQVETVLVRLLEENTPVYQNLIALLTDNQLALMRAIAREGVVAYPNSGEFVKRYGLKTPSSVNVALKSLQEKELIYKSAGGYRIYDRFMGLWLSHSHSIVAGGLELMS